MTQIVPLCLRIGVEKKMDSDTFIPKDIGELYEKLKTENLQGKLSKEGECLIWKLPNDIMLKISIYDIQSKRGTSFREGYIDTYYLKNGKEQNLTHWHPQEDEIWQDLMDINSGQIIWVRKKSIFGERIIIMDQKEYKAIDHKEKGKYTILVKKLSVEEAKRHIYDSLTEYTGWKFLKSQQCLKKTVKDMVFEIQFFSSKNNCSYESVEINCDFNIWCRKFDKCCNVKSIIGCYSFRPENGYWYDISDEEKLEKVLTKLKEKTKEYVLSITDKFEEDDEAALEFLANPEIQEIYHIEHFGNLGKLYNEETG